MSAPTTVYRSTSAEPPTEDAGQLTVTVFANGWSDADVAAVVQALTDIVEKTAGAPAQIYATWLPLVPPE